MATNRRFYRVWDAMNRRCNQKSHDYYHCYGGRGIRVEWKSYKQFKEDMESSFIEKTKVHGKDVTIDRIDNDGNYSKENCRWVTNQEQQNHRKNNHYIVLDGVKRTLTEWSRIYQKSPYLVESRIRALGWKPIYALTRPKWTHGRKFAPHSSLDNN